MRYEKSYFSNYNKRESQTKIYYRSSSRVMETSLVTIKYFFLLWKIQRLLVREHSETTRLSPRMQKSQYLRICYEHSLEYILILFKSALKWLSWTIDRTQERKRRGLGRRQLHRG